MVPQDFSGVVLYTLICRMPSSNTALPLRMLRVFGVIAEQKTQELKPRLPKQLITLEQIMHTTKFLILFHNYSYA